MRTLLIIAYSLITLSVIALLGLLTMIVIYLRRLVKPDKDILEDIPEDTPTIIDTSPKAVRERVSVTSNVDDESAVITAKTPQQIRQERDIDINSKLDKFTNG